MRTTALMSVVVLTAACVGSAAPSTSVESSTTSTRVVTATSTTVGPVSADVPRLGSRIPDDLLPIRVVEDGVFNVDASCVTAETPEGTLLLVFGGVGQPSVLGSEVVIEGFYPGLIPPRVLSSGARYDLRGIPDPFEAELETPMASGCEYDQRLILLGALDAPVGDGLATHPVEVLEAFPSIGFGPAQISIDGACTTISHPNGKLLVVWPAGTVSLLDNQTIHMSRWEGFAELVIRSGDTLSLQGYDSDRPADNPPADCEYDGTFWTGRVDPPHE